MASTLEVGKKLVALCREGKNVEAVEMLYDDHVVSIEAVSMPGMEQRTEGKAANLAKNKWWIENNTVHSSSYGDAWVNGERFTVIMKPDVTAKVGPMAGRRMQMEEVGLYTVKNGKITEEQFFYGMG